MKQTAIQRIQDWYKSQCNDDWEHSFGLLIETLDNPGWSVKIDLNDTELEDKVFEKKLDNGQNDWYSIWIKDKIFHGCGDPDKLELILEFFLNEFTNRGE